MNKKLTRYLERERKDCLDLKRKNDLTKNGQGQLDFINAICREMGVGRP